VDALSVITLGTDCLKYYFTGIILLIMYGITHVKSTIKELGFVGAMTALILFSTIWPIAIYSMIKNSRKEA
jgi:hypothetical protein